ncbi:MAG: hypothetical protein K5930_07645 [Treponemataceae bacterium]|nr:hypothetical protein [Treponemataceae bacterium]
MKRPMFVFILLFLASSVFCQNFTESGEILTLDGLSFASDILNEIVFENGEISIINYEGYFEEKRHIILNDKYDIEKKGSLVFLNLKNESKSFLCLASDEVLLLYDEKNESPFFFGFSSMRGLELISQPDKITASSELLENDYVYSASNLGNFNLSQPWVEGVPGNGEGEYITLSGNCTYIYLFNGYISYSKPYLYERNSRIKKIKITTNTENGEKEFIFNLFDTPNPQKINLGERVTDDIKLEILEVYPGTKYQDTCLNALLFKIF